MPRLFIAVQMPEAVRDALSELTYGLPGARWVPRDQFHLTLHFLGDVDGGTFADLRTALAGITLPSFRMKVKGLGHFPPRGAPKVLWAGIEKSEGLSALHAAVEKAVRSVGLPPEERKFHAHVTLARLKDTPPRRLADFLAGNGLFEAPSFDATSFVLMSSVLSPKGAMHEIEQEYALTPSG